MRAPNKKVANKRDYYRPWRPSGLRRLIANLSSGHALGPRFKSCSGHVREREIVNKSNYIPLLSDQM